MEYLQKMKKLVKNRGVMGGRGDDGITEENAAPIVKSLPTKAQGTQNWASLFRTTSMSKPLRVAGGAVNTAIVQVPRQNCHQWTLSTFATGNREAFHAADMINPHV